MALQKTAQSDVYFDAPAAKEPSGWDRFLFGAGQMGGRFLTGLAAGLQAYDPRNEFSSLGAALSASTPGIQMAIKQPLLAQQGEMLRQQQALGEMSALETDIAKQRRLVEGSAVIPGMEGKAAGIAAGVTPRRKPTAPAEPFDFKLFSAGPATTSSERVLRMMQGGPR
jgi:hypothetical protein